VYIGAVGCDEIKVREHGQGSGLGGLSWVRGGKRIQYLEVPPHGDLQRLWETDADGKKVPVVVGEFKNGEFEGARLSPTGRKVAFHYHNNGRHQIFVQDTRVDAPEPVLAVYPMFQIPGGLTTHLLDWRWSLDGRKLMVLLFRKGWTLPQWYVADPEAVHSLRSLHASLKDDLQEELDRTLADVKAEVAKSNKEHQTIHDLMALLRFRRGDGGEALRCVNSPCLKVEGASNHLDTLHLLVGELLRSSPNFPTQPVNPEGVAPDPHDVAREIAERLDVDWYRSVRIKKVEKEVAGVLRAGSL
jgi:hypothetical protein